MPAPLLDWQLAAQLHQMPAAHAWLVHTAGWHAWMSSAHGTHISRRPASADHAAGRMPVSWLLRMILHLFGAHRTQGG